MNNPVISLHESLLSESFKKLLNRPISLEFSNNLYNAPFVVVSHGIQTDPIFNYANLCAQQLWNLNWEGFTQMPSRLSAEPMEREERQIFLEKTARQGFVENYSGIRITSDNRRFMIKNAIIWNVIDAKGIYKGQAATFSDWEFLNS
ncbi:MAG: MEKHLA domain-containing protein [Cytophagaceae bacterium]